MSQKWRTMLGVSLGALCPPIGVSTISIGLPVIAAALHQPVTSAEWVIVIYTLVITSLLMTFGRLGDLISTKLLYVVGFIVFTLGALASGLSPSFDILGALIGSLALLCLLLVLSQGPSWGLASPPTIGLLLASIGLAFGFVRWERRAAAPMVDLSMFKDRLFSAALASSVLAYLAIFMLNLLVPFYLIHGLGFDFFHAGILLTPVPVAMVVFAPISGWLSDKVGSRALTSSGMLLVAVSFFWLSRLGLHPDYAQLVPPLLLNGIGTGLFTSPNNSAVMGAASRARMGTAAGLLATSRSLGMALGTATAAAVIALRMPAHLAEHGGATVATLASYQDGFLVAAAVALLAAMTSMVRGSAASADRSSRAVEPQAIG